MTSKNEQDSSPYFLPFVLREHNRLYHHIRLRATTQVRMTPHLHPKP